MKRACIRPAKPAFDPKEITALLCSFLGGVGPVVLRGLTADGAVRCCRRREAEAARDALQAQLEQAQAEMHTLTGALEAERSAAAADVASLRHNLQQVPPPTCASLIDLVFGHWKLDMSL